MGLMQLKRNLSVALELGETPPCRERLLQVSCSKKLFNKMAIYANIWTIARTKYRRKSESLVSAARGLSQAGGGVNSLFVRKGSVVKRIRNSLQL